MIIINLEKNEKIQKVKALLADKKVIIAFSGGVDSSLVAYLAKEFASDAYAITVQSEFITKEEAKDAMKIAKEIGIDWNILDLNLLNDPAIKDNPPDRCYVCKKKIIKTIEQIKNMEKFDIIIDGTNADDLKEERPGLVALKELNVISPLAEAGITKDEIRKIAKDLKLSSWDKPSMSCMATRFPSFYELKLKEINMVKKAEQFIKKEFGIKILRVKTEFKNARIVVGVEELEKLLDLKVITRLKSKLKELGFVQVSLDLDGYETS